MVQRLWRLVAVVALTVACDTRATGLVGVNPPATQIAFLTEPTDVQAGAAMTPAVQVVVRNLNGQTVTSGAVDVTLTLVAGTGTPGAALIGGGVQPTSGGIVNFTNIRVDLAGTGYQLLASAAGFPAVTSASFNVTP